MEYVRVRKRGGRETETGIEKQRERETERDAPTRATGRAEGKGVHERSLET